MRRGDGVGALLVAAWLVLLVLVGGAFLVGDEGWAENLLFWGLAAWIVLRGLAWLRLAPPLPPVVAMLAVVLCVVPPVAEVLVLRRRRPRPPA